MHNISISGLHYDIAQHLHFKPSPTRFLTFTLQNFTCTISIAMLHVRILDHIVLTFDNFVCSSLKPLCVSFLYFFSGTLFSSSVTRYNELNKSQLSNTHFGKILNPISYSKILLPKSYILKYP